ncbi:MAG: type II methionyl aminopeptidase [Candidatus Thermoplasmatota archaeon]
MLSDDVVEKYIIAGRIAKEAIEFGASLIKENEKLLIVAQKIEEFILAKGGKPAFPVNIAINDVAAHFTPKYNDERTFLRGDVVKLDVGVHYDGYIGDKAITIEVGTQNWTELIKASKEALNFAIEMFAVGVEYDSIGMAIERVIRSYNYVPIENLTGHSLERYNLHAGLSVPNIRGIGKGKVKDGVVLAIEPFATNGIGKVEGFKNSNIYRFVCKKFLLNPETKFLLKKIEEEFKTLPFTERWCLGYVKKIEKAIQPLVRSGCIKPYSTLKEVNRGIVSQAEETLIANGGECKVITR